MRRIYLVGMGAVVLFAQAVFGADEPKTRDAEGEPEFVLRGTVTDAKTGRPIAGAKVGDVEEYAGGKQWTTTDANGSYSYKTWYEEHGIKCQATGYILRHKILLTRPIGREKEKILDFELVPADIRAIAMEPLREVIPRVVATAPAAFVNDVSPEINKITVTFDLPMTDKSWSWTGSGDTYPRTTSEPYYDRSRRTCTLPVKLEAGKVYWVGINSPSHKNSQSDKGIAAKEYVILFSTRSADGKTTAIPEDMLAKAKVINEGSGRTFAEVEGGGTDRIESPEQKEPQTYIIEFQSVGPFNPRTAKELLDAFNEKHPEGVRTHHYRTEVKEHRLVGYICVDTEAGKDKIISMLKDSDKLELIKYEQADKIKLEKLFKMGQVSLDSDMEVEGTGQLIPKVVGTRPVTFADDVSADVNKITVTFDRPMMDQSWSWTGGGETYPETTGTPYYDGSKTTCTLPVRLEAGKVYWVGINSPSHKNFQTDRHIPAKRYVILFATKGADRKATAIPEDMLTKAKGINEHVGKTDEEVEVENRRAKLRVDFEKRMARDKKIYSEQELEQIEQLYQVANKKRGTAEARDSLEKLVARFARANRTGCAVLYLGQMSEGEQKERYLKRAIEDFSDCMYGDGVQVGAFARYMLAMYYKETGRKDEAKRLVAELNKDYPDAIGHNGELLIGKIPEDLKAATEAEK